MIDTAASNPVTLQRAPRRAVTAFKLVASFGLSAVLFWLAVRQVDLTQLQQSLGAVHYLDLAVATGVYFVDVACRAARWRVLLRPVARVSVRRLYPVLLVGYMANNLLPGRVGELSRAYLVGKRENISASSALASVALERIVDGLTVLALLFATLLVLPASDLGAAGWLTVLTRAAALTLGLALVAFAVLLAKRQLWVQISARILGILPANIGSVLLSLIDRFIAGLAVLRDPRDLALTLGWSVIVWIVGAITYTMVAAAFGVHLTLVEALATICVVNLATAVPQAPAGLGAFEVALVRVLALFGVAGSIAFGVTIVLHAVLILPVVVVGLVCLWRMKVSFFGLGQRSG